jgi:hypothetical protein
MNDSISFSLMPTEIIVKIIEFCCYKNKNSLSLRLVMPLFNEIISRYINLTLILPKIVNPNLNKVDSCIEQKNLFIPSHFFKRINKFLSFSSAPNEFFLLNENNKITVTLIEFNITIKRVAASKLVTFPTQKRINKFFQQFGDFFLYNKNSEKFLDSFIQYYKFAFVNILNKSYPHFVLVFIQRFKTKCEMITKYFCNKRFTQKINECQAYLCDKFIKFMSCYSCKNNIMLYTTSQMMRISALFIRDFDT